MSFLSRLSLANRSIVALVTIGIILFGAFVIPSLKQELLPSIAFPAISVVSVYPGASPANVERDVANPLEKNIQGVQGIQQLTSYSNEGTSLIIVQYNYGTDLDKASQTLSQQINKTQASLPTNVTPQVQTFNIADQPVINLAVTSTSLSQQDLAVQLNQNVVPVLQGISGVANVNVTGVRDQVVNVTLDLKKLQDNGLSVSQVQGALQANNITLPTGEVTNNGKTIAVQVNNTFNSLKDLQNVIVGLHSAQSAQTTQGATGTAAGASGGIPTGAGGQGGTYPGAQGGTGTGTGASVGAGTGTGTSAGATGSASTPVAAVKPTPVKLSDVASVQETLAPSTTLTRTNGQPSIGLSVTKTSDGNTVSISQAINNQLPALEQKLGSGAKISVISDQAPAIRTSVSDLVREGLIGAAFAILVILLFLFSIRSTLVTAISIPLSIIIALIGLWVGNYSLNVLTLGGLTIAVGRVIDDSIVVLENIYRHMRSGEDKRTAVLSGVREVAGAVTASTITTVAVFLPIAFTTGLVGEFFQPFSIAVTIALLASLFVALTIIPVLAYWFLKVPGSKAGQGHGEKPSLIERGYVPMLRWVTTHRAITLIVALLLLVGTFALYPLLETNLFGSSAQNTFSISLQEPAGSSLDLTNQAALKVEKVLAGTSGIQNYQATVGSGGSAFPLSSNSTNQASFAVTTNANADQNTVQQQVRDQLKVLPNIGTITLSTSQQTGSTSSIAVNVQASNDQTLRQAAQQVYNAVAQTPNLTDVTSSLTDAVPLIDVHVDSQKAINHGMTPAQVGQLLRSIYTGTTVTQVTLNGVQQDVDLKLGTPATTVKGM